MMKNTETKYKVISMFSVLTFFLIWQLAASAIESVFPTPLEVIHEGFVMFTGSVAGKSLIEHIYWSMRRVLIAYGLAMITGIPLGLYMGWNRIFDKIVKPIFEILRPIPPIAWIPLAILWMGIGEGPKVFICYVGAFVIFVLNSYTGMRYTDQLLLNAAKTLGANRKQQFYNVALPASLPSIFAGVQNGLSMSWMCVLAAEMVGAREGVGFIILNGMDTSNSAMIVVGMLLIGFVGALLANIMKFIERRLCPWRKDLLI